MKKNKSFLLAGLATLSLVFAMSCSNPSSSASDSTSSTPAVKPTPKPEKVEELKTAEAIKAALKTNTEKGLWTFKATQNDGATVKEGTAVVTNETTLNLFVEDVQKGTVTLGDVEADAIAVTGGTDPFGFIDKSYKVTKKGEKVIFTEYVAPAPASEGVRAVSKEESAEAPKTVPVVLEFSTYKAPVTITYVTAHGTAPEAIVVPYGHKLVSGELPATIDGADNCGFTFKKQWNNGDNAAAATNVITANTTLTAVWEDVAPEKVDMTAPTTSSNIEGDSITVTWADSTDLDVVKYVVTLSDSQNKVVQTAEVGKGVQTATLTECNSLASGTYTLVLTIKDAKNSVPSTAVTLTKA